ncbi:MAG: alpha-ribazole phosphatase [Bacteroidaceae bacterium]|nr:alpha-ribazole phosphatase [Bacteroidaceae bacterium]MBR1541275.1 alpha-ribazole phosphatase [Bacteroidaceae bacterium]
MKITLIRHTSVNVPPGICYGQTDVAVKASFPQEATQVNENLEAHRPFDKVYCSPLTRAVKLATFCGYPDAEPDKRLLEMNMGDWEMQLYDEIKDPVIDEWYKDYIHTPTPHGESFVMQYQRVSQFLDELRQQPYQRVAIFAHGGVLACAQVYAGQATFATAFTTLVPYGGIIEIEI